MATKTREYRIVTTVDTEHGDGRKYHYENVTPWVDGHLFHHRPYKTKSEAQKVLAVLRKRCADFDRKTQIKFKRDPINCIAYKQTNLRIQMREVTPWGDVEK